MNTHLSASIELSAAQIRAAKIVANRRALAALLHHHGDRPPEQGCSAEALRIRRDVGAAARRPKEQASDVPGEGVAAPAAAELSEAAVRLMAEKARPAILAIVAEVAARYMVPTALMLAPPRRAALESVERRAQLANRETMHRCYHEACRSFRALGLHFGKHPTSIRSAARLHADRIEAGEGNSK